MLDYGGGNGLTARLLREAGFKHVEVYDPFVPEYVKRPKGEFDIIMMFEVLEHSPTPKETTPVAESLNHNALKTSLARSARNSSARYRK